MLTSLDSRDIREFRPFDHIETGDLIKFGMIPEFVGRLPIVCNLEALGIEDLTRVLVEPKNALMRQYQRNFALNDVELTWSDDALRCIAMQAITRRAGARGLRQILEQTLLTAMYDVPGRDDVEKVVLEADPTLSRLTATMQLRGSAH